MATERRAPALAGTIQLENVLMLNLQRSFEANVYCTPYSSLRQPLTLVFLQAPGAS
jgi:hypothetical protein